MPNDQAKNLLSALEENLNSGLSDSQRALMQQVNNHIHAKNEPERDDPSLQETLELLLLEIEQQHPKAAIITREIIKTLSDMGI
jgi:signal recognition particle GTPase